MDGSDARVRAARDAERRLFDHHGLEHEEHFVELADPALRIRVLEAGEGPPVLLVPGGVGDAWIFASLMERLEGVRMLAVNRPGGGLSEGVDHRLVDVRRLAVDTLSSVLDHFGLARPPLIGNSMGGLWSFWLALDRPDRVSALVQVGTPALILGTSAPLPMRLQSVPLLNRLMLRMMLPSTTEEARKLPTFLGHPAKVGERWPEAAVECAYHFPRLPTYRTAWLSLMERCLRLTGAEPDVQLGEGELEIVAQPTQLIWGRDDPFGSLDVARRAVDALPDAELHPVGVGHLPWLDDAERCGSLIGEFLEERRAGGATGGAR